MGARIRPSVLGNVPVLAFGLGAGSVSLVVDDMPGVVRGCSVLLGVGGILFVAVLLTTWFEFGEGVTRASAVGRVRCFRVGETTLKLHSFSAGFFADQTGVELRSGNAHLTIPLAVFSRKDRALIERELRARFGVTSSG